MSDLPAHTSYGPQDQIFPSQSDDDLWKSVLAAITAEYPERALLEHVRQAFEEICAQQDDYMLFKDFLRKVRIAWLWKRPPAPRGLLTLE